MAKVLAHIKHNVTLTSSYIILDGVINHKALTPDHACKHRVKPVGLLSTFIGKQITVQPGRMFQLLSATLGVERNVSTGMDWRNELSSSTV